MTPEAVERAIQFILEQQAAVEALLHEGQSLTKRTQIQIEENAHQIRQLTTEARERDAQSRQSIADLAERIDTLRDACRELNEHAGFTDYRLNRLENPPSR